MITINNTVEKLLQTIFPSPLPPPPSISTLQFSLVSIYLVHQPIYLSDSVMLLFFTAICFDFFLVTVLFFFTFFFFSGFYLRFLVVFVVVIAVAAAAVVFVTAHLLFTVS